MLEFLKIHSLPDILQKYNLSWLTASGLTLAMPKIEVYLPLIIQLFFIVLTQIIAFGIDFLRLVYLKQKAKTKIEIINDKIKIDTEIQKDDPEI